MAHGESFRSDEIYFEEDILGTRLYGHYKYANTKMEAPWEPDGSHMLITIEAPYWHNMTICLPVETTDNVEKHRIAAESMLIKALSHAQADFLRVKDFHDKYQWIFNTIENQRTKIKDESQEAEIEFLKLTYDSLFEIAFPSSNDNDYPEWQKFYLHPDYLNTIFGFFSDLDLNAKGEALGLDMADVRTNILDYEMRWNDGEKFSKEQEAIISACAGTEADEAFRRIENSFIYHRMADYGFKGGEPSYGEC